MPTAVHAVRDVHDTPYRMDPFEGRGLGVRWIAHFVPFHRSATDVPVAGLYPTALQKVRDVHDRPWRSAPPRGLGVRWIAHFPPVHLSASDVLVGGAVSEYPTAVQEVREMHDTPSRVVTVDVTGANAAAAGAPDPRVRVIPLASSAAAMTTRPGNALILSPAYKTAVERLSPATVRCALRAPQRKRRTALRRSEHRNTRPCAYLGQPRKHHLGGDPVRLLPERRGRADPGRSPLRSC